MSDFIVKSNGGLKRIECWLVARVRMCWGLENCSNFRSNVLLFNYTCRKFREMGQQRGRESGKAFGG